MIFVIKNVIRQKDGIKNKRLQKGTILRFCAFAVLGCRLFLQITCRVQLAAPAPLRPSPCNPVLAVIQIAIKL